ncbi:MAG: PAS domain S-box protein [Planctomycetes bacterium]|nr:PAS domain S-box protein [Planctomycetota bacterium]
MPDANDIQMIGELIAQFDASTAKLKSSHDSLQARIAELTGELAEKNEALSRTLVEANALKNYLAHVLESITDGVLAIDLDKKVVALNEAAAELIPNLASDREGVLVFEVLPEVCEELGKVLVKALEEQQRFTNIEVRFNDADGRMRTLSVSASPIRSDNGVVLGAVETFRDLTELKELEERANRQERLAALGEMAAGVAHEIRNPLGGIELYASVIKRNISDDECKESQLADKIMAAAGSLNRIVTDMLTFTRSREPVRKQVSIERICHGAVEFASNEIADKDIQVSFNFTTNQKPVALDDELLGRAFLNIVLNAVQVMESGGALAIQADFAEDGRELVVKFIDNGPGIPEDAKKNIFNPFFTLRKDGTGLGLAIVHKIIQDHGGTVTVEDNTTSGAVFIFRLPVGGA